MTVNDPAHGRSNASFVTYSGGSSVAGLNLNGEFQIAVVGGNSYTITASKAANANATGGGNVSVTYPIVIPLIVPGMVGVPFGTGTFGEGQFGYRSINNSQPQQGWTLASYGNQLLAAPIGFTRMWTWASLPSPLLVSPTTQRTVSPADTETSFSPASKAMSVTWLTAA